MTKDVKASLANVIEAMEALNDLFVERIDALRREGADVDEVGVLEKGVLAMKDAGRIYLTWSNHFIEKLVQAEGLGPMDD